MAEVLLQKLPSGLRPGDRVRVRGDDWRVTAVSAGSACEALDLDGTGRTNHGLERTLLYPFDRPCRRPAGGPPENVARRRWTRRLLSVLESCAPHDGLRRTARARLQLLPYQLEPALALVRGLTTRLLLADEPGLGKTVQAGLALSELIDRHLASRVLVLTPAGLRDQWKRELAERFSIEAAVIDGHELLELVRALPAGANPWQLRGTRIVSLDFVRQPEVLQGLLSLAWDILIVDEAHHAAPGTDRGRAVGSLARRARQVMLLTATPHTGSDEAFTALCDTGRLAAGEPPVLLFRRSRADAGLLSTRRLRLLAVRPTTSERRLHRLLDAYVRALLAAARDPRRGQARLAGMLLRRRALSCCRSLAISAVRRRALLEGVLPDAEQMPLPLDTADGDVPDDEVRGALLAVPAFSDVSRERAWLDAIIEAARLADGSDSKLAALRRLLRRVPEPAIVFTEYRDTLDRVREALDAPDEIVMLHGSLSTLERRDAERRFTTGRARLLLATDAAGEGLNLHVRCRLVISLEVPWTPIRLEQRIGRVDRIGQTRTPHGLLLAVRSSAEFHVLGRLVARLERIRLALGRTAGLIGPSQQQALEDALIANRSTDALHDEERWNTSAAPLPASATSRFARIDLSAAAAAEVARLRRALVRSIRSGSRPSSSVAVPRRPWQLHLRRRPRTPVPGLPPESLVVVHSTPMVDAAGTLVERVVAVHCVALSEGRIGASDDPEDVMRRLVAGVLPRLAREAQVMAERRRAAVEPARAASIAPILTRARLVQAVLVREGRHTVQLGLFHRPAGRFIEGRDKPAPLVDEALASLKRLEASASVHLEPPEAELILLVRRG